MASSSWNWTYHIFRTGATERSSLRPRCRPSGGTLGQLRPYRADSRPPVSRTRPPRPRDHMKDYIRGPTEAQLIEALETLQKAAGERARTERDRLGAVRSVARANPEPQNGTIRYGRHSTRQ